MAVIEFTKEDVGKSVVDATGDPVGRIVDTQGGAAYVEPDPNLVDTVSSKLGWSDRDEDAYELKGIHADRVTEDRVHLDSL